MTDLTIVIVSFNARQDLAACLASLRAAPPRVAHQIVVVDNASDDDSVAAARAVPGVTVLPLDRNAGFAAANNVGIRATHGELVLLLNSDTIVPPGAIDALVDRLRRDPSIGVAGPRLVDGEDARAVVRPDDHARGGMVAEEVPPGDRARLADAHRLAAQRNGAESFPDWVSGACMLVRRRDAVAAGLLDERFFLYTEDVDFCHVRSGSSVARYCLHQWLPSLTSADVRGPSRPEASRQACRRSHLAFYENTSLWAPLLKRTLRIRGEL